MLRPAALALLSDSEHRFCASSSCPIVYFGPVDLFRTEQVGVAVFQKTPPGARTVCYCFAITEDDIGREIDASGRTLVVERITSLVKAGRCACELRNPQGTCCLGNVAAVASAAAATSLVSRRKQLPAIGTTAMSETGRDLVLRIIVVDPPPGVVFAVQHGREELEAPQVAAGSELRFDVAVQVRGDRDGVDFRGPAVQGRRGDRFIYVNSGTLAGQESSCWTRRAKVKLASIAPELLGRARQAATGVLEARIAGRANDGGPACATVPLLGEGWQLAALAARGVPT